MPAFNVSDRPDGDQSEVSRHLLELADAFHGLRQRVQSEHADTLLDAITQVAVATLTGADWASITLLTDDRFRTTAATDSRARQADEVQYQLRSGPCVDAVVENSTSHIPDTRTDSTWPKFSRQVADDLGVGTVLSFRLIFDDTDHTIGGLNLYSLRPNVFRDEQLTLGTLLATHGGLAVTAAQNRRRADELVKALESNREIGIAMGVLMTQHKVTRDQAFDLLRIASQHQHRKLRDVAADVADTGTLELPQKPKRQAP